MDRSMIRTCLFAAFLATTLATGVVGQTPTTPENGDETYQPTAGQRGKDVVWIPSPDSGTSTRTVESAIRPTSSSD